MQFQVSLERGGRERSDCGKEVGEETWKQEDGVMGEGVKGQGMQAVSEAREGRQMDCPLQPPGGTSPANALILGR